MDTPKAIWRAHYGKPSTISKKDAVDLVEKFYEKNVKFSEPDDHGYMRCFLPNNRKATICHHKDTGVYATIYHKTTKTLESSSICRSFASARKHLIYLYEKEMRELGVRDPWSGSIPKEMDGDEPISSPEPGGGEASPFVRAIASGDDLSEIKIHTIVHLLEFLGIDPWRDEKDITISQELDDVLWDLVGTEKIENSCFNFMLEARITYGTTPPLSECWGIARAVKQSAGERFRDISLTTDRSNIAYIHPYNGPVGRYITAAQLVEFLSDIRKRAGEM